MKQTVHIEYSTLKDATLRVLAFARTYTDAHQKIDLRTSIADDLGMAGLDLLLFWEDFERTFSIPLPSYTEPPKTPPIVRVRNAVAGVLRLVFFPVTVPYFLFAKESSRQKIRRNARRHTLGDLAASLALGRYVKRETLLIYTK